MMETEAGESAEVGEILVQSGNEGELQLGHLNEVTEILVQQLINTQEMLRGTEEPNQYVIKEKGSEEILYKVQEEEEVLMQQCCGGNRSFTLRLSDKFNREIIKIIRPHISCRFCFGITDCYDAVEIWVRNYKSFRLDWKLWGQVRSFWNPIFPYFQVCDCNGNVKCCITGPLLLCGASSFNIKPSLYAQPVGLIKKKWSGICREYNSTYDLFSIQFPSGSDEKLKATLLGALFLIEFKFYEACSIRCC